VSAVTNSTSQAAVVDTGTSTLNHPRKPKVTSAIYGTKQATLFVPTEQAWLFHLCSEPIAVLERAGLTSSLWGKEWKSRYGEAHPWLFSWLYDYPSLPPKEAARSSLPTPAMHAFRKEATISAIAAAVSRLAKDQPTTRHEKCSSTGPIYALLEKYPDEKWLEGRLFRGEEEPPHVTVATLEQIRYCRQVWDFAAHCKKAGLGSPNTNYCRWISQGYIRYLDLLEWLFGDDPPDNLYVLPPSLERLRNERTLESICLAAKVTITAYRKWLRFDRLKAAFDAIQMAFSERKSLDRAGPWDELIKPETSKRMKAWVKAASLASCCERADLKVVNYCQEADKAGRCCVRDQLEHYLGIRLPLPDGPVKCGLLSTGFFVPTPGMREFRTAALAVRGRLRRCSGLRDLPGYDEWFSEWTIPFARNGKQRLLPRLPAFPVPMAAAAYVTNNTRPVNPETPAPREADTQKRRRGRRRGSIDLARLKRMEQMLSAWDEQRYGDNKAKTGRMFGFDRFQATNIINEHDARKRCN
jgi:hypothetical protein